MMLVLDGICLVAVHMCAVLFKKVRNAFHMLAVLVHLSAN